MKDIGPVVYRNISELKPYKNNARTHSKKQVKQIAASIVRQPLFWSPGSIGTA